MKRKDLKKKKTSFVFIFIYSAFNTVILWCPKAFLGPLYVLFQHTLHECWSIYVFRLCISNIFSRLDFPTQTDCALETILPKAKKDFRNPIPWFPVHNLNLSHTIILMPSVFTWLAE